MRFRVISLVCVLLFATALHAAPFPHIPLDAGNTWTVRVDGSGAFPATVLATPIVVNGVAAAVIQQPDGYQEYWTSDASGVRFHGYFDPAFDVGTAASTVLSPPMPFGNASLQFGSPIRQTGGAAVTLSGASNGTLSLSYTSDATTQDWEVVTVPAGTFRALRVVTSINMSGRGVSSSATSTYWLANNVGPVKQIDSDGTTTTTQELLSCNFPVGARRPPGNDLLIDFGPQYGLWLRQNDSAWVGVHSVSAQHMASGDLDNDGRSDVLIDFGAPYGIWARRNGESWTSIHGTSAQQIVATDLDNNGHSDFVVNFGPPHGLWVRMNDAAWTLLHGTAPRQLVSANLDADPRRDLVVDFGPPYGIWLRMNNTNWVALHGTSARDMVAGDLDGNGIDEIVIDFGPPYGIWTRLNQQNWVQLHGTSSRHMAVGNFDSDARKDVVIDFGAPHGIWQWRNNSAWSLIHGTSAPALTVADMDRSGIDDLVVSFGDPHGLWAWKNGTSWQVQHGVSPPRLIATDVDGQ